MQKTRPQRDNRIQAISHVSRSQLPIPPPHTPSLLYTLGVVVFTEIYQVTGPLHRFCRQIASQGYVVACNESFHEFEQPGVAIPYDVEGTLRAIKHHRVAVTIEEEEKNIAFTSGSHRHRPRQPIQDREGARSV